MVLGKLPVPGRPSNLADSRARGLLRSQWVRWRVVWTFLLSSIFSLLFLPLTEILSQRTVKPKTTNHVFSTSFVKRYNFRTFLYDSLVEEALPNGGGWGGGRKGGLPLKEKITPAGAFFSF